MRKFFLLTILFLICTAYVIPQSANPKREFRGAWIATVTNLDWPKTRGTSPTVVAQQKLELIQLLDKLDEININAVVFQVRSECDAMYPSPIEPWSYWLTGQQGANPNWDPLQFAIEETHKRGMELHVWFNPYRAERSVGNYPLASNHVTVQHPEYALQIGTLKFLNPGMHAVRNYILSVIMDVVRRYDIDALHMDDYFYPYPPNQISNQDANTFAAEPRGFTNINDWRRDNINILMKAINDSVKTAKPWVKFGMSPFGIWKNGVPPGITGLDAYSTIYCDAINWLQNKSVDYLTPQLYWPIGGSQDYIKLSRWWADSTFRNGRHFYPGQASYRISSWSSPSEIHNQIRENRANPKTGGSIFFRAEDFSSNPKGFADTLKGSLFNTKSILPTMSWLDVVAPNAPQNLRFERAAGSGITSLQWDKPATAADGDSAYRYVIYKTTQASITPSVLADPANINDIVGYRNSNPEIKGAQGVYYFGVTSLDRNHNESGVSNVIQMNVPSVAAPVSPANGANDVSTQLTLRWSYAQGATQYRVQLGLNTNFDSLLINSVYFDTLVNVQAALRGQKTYYWRVRSENPAGNAAYSQTFSFTTAFPAAPALALPLDKATNVSTDTFLVWRTNSVTTSYDVQLATTNSFEPSTIVLNLTNVTDTTAQFTGLLQNKIYYWRVRGTNQFGTGEWAPYWAFKTFVPVNIEEEGGTPTEYNLYQNYPNPFNPETTIRFSLLNSGFTTLKVYDVLGKLVKVLVDDELRAGFYNVRFDASSLASGTYIYELVSGNQIFRNKMIFLK
ncbi:MAG: family 10 glycosylhydrolase [Ignavibacteriaceae bacterium]|nr:family 10 glycosylhydrolase [Ignavibacteriaceae bacterium]